VPDIAAPFAVTIVVLAILLAGNVFAIDLLIDKITDRVITKLDKRDQEMRATKKGDGNA
jgi:hypothetical protein